MENPNASDLLNVEILLNSADWEVGIAVAPTLSGCDDQASDETDRAVSL